MQRLGTTDTHHVEGTSWPATLGSVLSGRRAQARRQQSVVFVLILSDSLLAWLVWSSALVVHSFFGSGPLTELAATSVLLNVAVWIGLRAMLGLYPGYGLDLVEELRRQTYALAATLAIVTTFALALKVGDLLSRLLLVSSFLGLVLLAPFARHFVKRGMRRLELWGKPVAILGADEAGTRVIRSLLGEWELGLRPVAVFDDRKIPEGAALQGVPYGGTMADAGVVAQKYDINTAILAIPHAQRKRLTDLVDSAGSSFHSVIVIPDLGGVTNSIVVARDLGGVFGAEIKHNLLNPWSRRVKRTLDLFGVGVGGLFISPFLLALVILIKLDSPGPAIYAQQRLGAGEKHFRCWKFRTMCLDAEKALDEYLQNNPDLRAEWEKDHKLRKDPRITRIGRLLRETSLDELPQLWNVLKGEMSLVGPRPIINAEVSKYGSVYGLYCRVRPGISGIWQVSGRSDTSYEERVAMDAYYVRNWSVWLDLVILARTATSVLRRRGAC